MKILSLHSAVAYGRVGNSALTIPLAAVGCEVIPLNTTRLAHHPGYGPWCGRIEETQVLSEMVEALANIGLFDRIDGLLSGYLGSGGNAEPVFSARRYLRRGAPWLCDPVIGDFDTGIYVQPDVISAIRDQLAPQADIMTPNAFELGILTGMPTDTAEAALTAARSLIGGGPKVIAVTTAPVAADRTGVLLVSADSATLMTTPVISVDVKGTGDLFAGHLLAGIISGMAPADSCQAAIGRLYMALRLTEQLKADELMVLDPASNPALDLTMVERTTL